MSRNITIKDIATALGVSVSTVSRALQDNPAISESRRKEIQEYAQEHRYQPNTVATTLRSSRQARGRIIGVVLPQLEHFYFSHILSGIEQKCDENGFHAIVTQSGDKYEKECRVLDDLRRLRVAGIIISQSKETTQYSHFQDVIEDGIPMVFVDRICTGIRTSRVVVDDYAGAFTATEHLIESGCKRIAFFGATMNLEISKNRFNGYRDALLTHKLTVDKELVHICDHREEADVLTPQLMQMENHPDGFFCINDDTALGVLYTCKNMGFHVPEDVCICGFTDGVRARSCDPQLTSVEQRGNKVGEEAVAILLEHISGEIPEGKFRNSIIKTKLVVRGTTRPKKDSIK